MEESSCASRHPAGGLARSAAPAVYHARCSGSLLRPATREGAVSHAPDGLSDAGAARCTAAAQALCRSIPSRQRSPGTAQEGQTLTLANGTWTNTPTGYAYREGSGTFNCDDGRSGPFTFVSTGIARCRTRNARRKSIHLHVRIGAPIFGGYFTNRPQTIISA